MDIDYSQIVGYSIGIDKESKKDIKYVLAGNGSVEIRENEIAVFISAVKKIPGLEDVKEGVKMKLPKIPANLLFQTISFFKDVNDKYKAEAIVQIYYNREAKEYYLYCPKQTVSGAAVDFKRDKKRDRDHLLVADIHSHNTMDAFFSGTDDSDEKEARIYGVIGKIDEPMPKMLFRVATGHGTASITPGEVFELSASYPPFWMKQVSEHVYASTLVGASEGGFLYGGGWKSGNWKTGRWDSKSHSWVDDSNTKDKEEKTPLLPTDEREAIDIDVLREALLKRLSKEDKEFLATELWGSLQSDIGGPDNGGYPIGE